MDSYIGSIWSFGFNYPPYGFAGCNGQLLQIAQYQALFSLIGTTYGGDGVNTFAVPNLQGRTPIGTGQGAGLPNYVLGQSGGSTSVTLTSANLPAHTHTVLSIATPVSTSNAALADPNGNYLAASGASGNTIANAYSTGTTPSVQMAALAAANTAPAGNGIPLDITSPYMAVNYCISLEGLYPQRN